MAEKKRPAPDAEPEDAPRPKRMVPTTLAMRNAFHNVVYEAWDTDMLDALRDNGAISRSDFFGSLDRLVDRPLVLKWVLDNTSNAWDPSTITGVMSQLSRTLPSLRILCDHFPGALNARMLQQFLHNLEVFRFVVSRLGHIPERVAWDLVCDLAAGGGVDAPSILSDLHSFVDWESHRGADLDLLVRVAIDHLRPNVLEYVLKKVGYDLPFRVAINIFAGEARVECFLPVLYAHGYSQRSPILLECVAEVLRKFLAADSIQKWYLLELVAARRFGICVYPKAPANGAKWKRGSVKKFEDAMYEVEAPRRALVRALSPILPEELAEECGDFIVLRP